MNLPDFFTDKDELLNYNFPQLKNLVNTDIDYSTIIENLSPLVKKELLVEQYFKSILLGYNHLPFQHLMDLAYTRPTSRQYLQSNQLVVFSSNRAYRQTLVERHL